LANLNPNRDLFWLATVYPSEMASQTRKRNEVLYLILSLGTDLVGWKWFAIG